MSAPGGSSVQWLGHSCFITCVSSPASHTVSSPYHSWLRRGKVGRACARVWEKGVDDRRPHLAWRLRYLSTVVSTPPVVGDFQMSPQSPERRRRCLKTSKISSSVTWAEGRGG